MTKQVNEFIHKGFEPFGSVFFGLAPNPNIVYQPMVKKSFDNTPPESRG